MIEVPDPLQPAGDWSKGVALAWRIAVAESNRQGYDSVEPLHLLIGICSIGKAVSGETMQTSDVPMEADSGVRREYAILAAIFGKLGMNESSLRRAARASTAGGRRGSDPRKAAGPSEITSAVLQLALRAAEECGNGPVGLPAILLALLGSPASQTPEFLAACRVDVDAFKAALREALSSGAPVSPAPLRGIEVSQTMSIDGAAPAIVADTMRARVALLCELPVAFAGEVAQDSLLETIVEKLMAIIPGAERGALLIRDAATGKLLLKAHRPAGRHAVSLTLAQRAMDQRQGFIWRQGQDLNASILELCSMSGMYAPLIWCDEVLGVLCVDNPGSSNAFQDEDLRMFLAVSRYAALAVSNLNMQIQLRQNATLLARLLTNFSPKLRDSLLAKARQGKLRLGGERSEVTILCGDIRGFTRLTADMDAQEVMDLLNAYFPALVDAVFRFNGAIDKFIGDAVLAVFGSPEPDASQHENAIRAAAEMQAAMRSLNADRARRGLTVCEIGIGIHCGEVLHGFVGSPERTEFTVIGDVVNKTVRYCDGAGASEILISPRLYEQVWRLIQADLISMPTKHEGPLPAYRIASLKSK